MSTIEKAAARLASRERQKSGTSEDAAGAAVLDAAELLAERAAAAAALQPSVSRAAGLRYVEIDLEALKARGFITPKAGRSQLGQEMRRIKRPLLLNCQKAAALGQTDGNPANVIMVTSALPGEGKTFVSINLAMSLAAELDRRVLLVDADVARGDVSRTLGIEPARGLSDLLHEESRIAEDGVLGSNVDGLSILPAGSALEHVDELYAGAFMHDIVLALAHADPRRLVIFDSSPLLATTEAAVLARNMGQIVMVVEADRTPQKAVTEALAMLDGYDNVSLVLNKTTSSESASYGYGYGYGSETQDKQPTADRVDEV